MDRVTAKAWCLEFLKKYRFVLIVILAGIILMALPEGKKETVTQPETVPQETESGLEGSLSEILSLIEGAGKVRVLLTEAAGAETWFQTDEDTAASGDRKEETVIITDADRAETGLVRRTDPPIYQGAIVLCQGADSPAIRLAIVEAVANATGLTSDKISVLKMK
ncbi:MAG: hypothetical protein IJ001_06580 [Oscillospiraceae bacterium]|nr:hypothetical protein [Oscillospiraceae bacterium]